MKKLTPIICVLASFIALTANAQNIAIVNGKPITKAKLDDIAKMLPNGQDENIRKKIKETLINRELFLQEAQRKQVMLRPEVQMQLEEAKNAILFSAVLEDYLNSSVSDQELRKQYEIVSKAESGKQYRAKHILVKTPEEAGDILAQLKQGKNFEALAKEKSIDKGSAVNGGDLDWAKPELFVPAFSQAMIALNKGETTKQAVQTQFGYHIIKLEDIKDAVPPKFEEVKPQLAEMLKASQEWQKQKLDELQKELRTKAVIK